MIHSNEINYFTITIFKSLWLLKNQFLNCMLDLLIDSATGEPKS